MLNLENQHVLFLHLKTISALIAPEDMLYNMFVAIGMRMFTAYDRMSALESKCMLCKKFFEEIYDTK